MLNRLKQAAYKSVTFQEFLTKLKPWPQWYHLAALPGHGNIAELKAIFEEMHNATTRGRRLMYDTKNTSKNNQSKHT